jgi:hypothetical protein
MSLKGFEVSGLPEGSDVDVSIWSRDYINQKPDFDPVYIDRP